MLKILYIFIALMLIQPLSFAAELEICVKFQKADKSPSQGRFSCLNSSQECKEKAQLPPPPSFYLPTIEITPTDPAFVLMGNNYKFHYRDQTVSKDYKKIPRQMVSYGYSMNSINNIEELQIIAANLGIGLMYFFNWTVCRIVDSFCKPIQGELIINFVEGTYEVRGDIKKNCGLFV